MRWRMCTTHSFSKRVHKPAFSHKKAIAIIREGRRRHFDPDVVDVMNAIEATFQQLPLSPR